MNTSLSTRFQRIAVGVNNEDAVFVCSRCCNSNRSYSAWQVRATETTQCAPSRQRNVWTNWTIAREAVRLDVKGEQYLAFSTSKTHRDLTMSVGSNVHKHSWPDVSYPSNEAPDANTLKIRAPAVVPGKTLVAAATRCKRTGGAPITIGESAGRPLPWLRASSTRCRVRRPIGARMKPTVGGGRHASVSRANSR